MMVDLTPESTSISYFYLSLQRPSFLGIALRLHEYVEWNTIFVLLPQGNPLNYGQFEIRYFLLAPLFPGLALTDKLLWQV